MITVLAAVEPANPDWGKAAPVGLFILLAFVVACFFLFRSMSRHMRKIPSSFDEPTPPPTEANRLGAAKISVPTATEPLSATAARPRLGTPEEVLDLRESKRNDKIRAAKARQARRRK